MKKRRDKPLFMVLTCSRFKGRHQAVLTVMQANTLRRLHAYRSDSDESILRAIARAEKLGYEPIAVIDPEQMSPCSVHAFMLRRKCAPPAT